MSKITDSFSSANVNYPIKLIKDKVFCNSITTNGFVTPIHLQWIPTNKCNFNCSFCSCRDRDLTMEHDISHARDAIEQFAAIGTESVTITGGGEPTLYKHFDDLIKIFLNNNIEIGLVTNGLKYKNLNYDLLKNMRWLRLSLSDEYGPIEKMIDVLETLNNNLGPIDLSTSYVVTQFNVERISAIIETANRLKLSHVRIVNDILNPMGMRDNCSELFKQHDLSRIIFQPRSEYLPGVKDCWISLAKPIIGADENIYPCCGVQYAIKDTKKDLTDQFSMGSLADIDEIWSEQKRFNGSVCEVCYYTGYNELISRLKAPVKHLKFI